MIIKVVGYETLPDGKSLMAAYHEGFMRALSKTNQALDVKIMVYHHPHLKFIQYCFNEGNVGHPLTLKILDSPDNIVVVHPEVGTTS